MWDGPCFCNAGGFVGTGMRGKVGAGRSRKLGLFFFCPSPVQQVDETMTSLLSLEAQSTVSSYKTPPPDLMVLVQTNSTQHTVTFAMQRCLMLRDYKDEEEEKLEGQLPLRTC